MMLHVDGISTKLEGKKKKIATSASLGCFMH